MNTQMLDNTRPVRALRHLTCVLSVGLGACSSTGGLDAGTRSDAASTRLDAEGTDAVAPGVTRFRGEAWADNWFQLSLGETLLVEDSVSITTERSFNAERFDFEANYPLQLSFVLKDFKENDTGLEYIGKANQQMGDGGFIFQLTDLDKGGFVVVSSSAWRCHAIHRAPLNKSCEHDLRPEQTCQSWSEPEPQGWRAPGFDDGSWAQAVEFSASAVGPKDGYDSISWSADARFIWTDDLETDNTILCRVRVEAP